MDVVQWQAQQRRRFGRAQAFARKNISADPVLPGFQVTNPKSGGASGRRWYTGSPAQKRQVRNGQRN